MALTESHTTAGSFTEHVKRNVRTVLAMKGLRQLDVAPLIGMGETKFSTRISGETRWLAEELVALATALGVSVEVLAATDEAAFRKGISRSGYIAISPIAAGQSELLSRDMVAYNAVAPLAVAV